MRPCVGGRLFFVGPVTELNPVSDFRVVVGDGGGGNGDGVDADTVTVRMIQIRGEIEGAPPGVVGLYTAAEFSLPIA